MPRTDSEDVPHSLVTLGVLTLEHIEASGNLSYILSQRRSYE